jgi:hypothetical protein
MEHLVVRAIYPWGRPAGFHGPTPLAVPKALVEEFIGRRLSAGDLQAHGAIQRDGYWVITFRGRDYALVEQPVATPRHRYHRTARWRHGRRSRQRGRLF